LILGLNNKGQSLLFSTGLNVCGQLGLEHFNNQNKLSPVIMPKEMKKIESIYATENKSYIVGRNKKDYIVLVAFGDNKHNQLGIANNCSNITIPTIIPPPSLSNENTYESPTIGF